MSKYWTREFMGTTQEETCVFAGCPRSLLSTAHCQMLFYKEKEMVLCHPW